MKGLFFSIASVLLMFTLPMCAGMSGARIGSGKAAGLHGSRAGSGPVDGFYEGIAPGYRGDIHVRLCLTGGIIREIEILDSGEDRFVGDAAIEELQELVLIYNTTDIDAVSGATESSWGFLAAVQDALEKARLFTRK